MLKTLSAYGFCFAILQLLIACGPSEQAKGGEAEVEAVEEIAQTSASEADMLVLAFGDSLYAGYGLAPNEGFVPELEKALNAAGKDVRVHNAGVSGDTTGGGLRRLNFVLDSLSKNPDLLILGLGANDMLRGLKPEDTRANLDKMMTEISDRDIPILITGMLAPPNLGQDFGDKFNVIYPALAKKHGATLYPFFMDGVVGRSDLFLADGVHPNAEGIDIVIENIAPVVAGALGE